MYRYCNMTETETKLVRIDSELRNQIERVVSSSKVRGVPKYKSVPKFVEKACILLLDSEDLK